MARTPSKQPNPGRPPVHGMPLIPDPLPRQPHFGAARAAEFTAGPRKCYSKTQRLRRLCLGRRASRGARGLKPDEASPFGSH